MCECMCSGAGRTAAVETDGGPLEPPAKGIRPLTEDVEMPYATTPTYDEWARWRDHRSAIAIEFLPPKDHGAIACARLLEVPGAPC